MRSLWVSEYRCVCDPLEYRGDKVYKLNALCRQICEQIPEYGEIMVRLQEIEQGPVYSMPMQYFGFGMISAFFTLFYGGVLVDAAAAFVLGVLLKVVIHQLEKLEAAGWPPQQETRESFIQTVIQGV